MAEGDKDKLTFRFTNASATFQQLMKCCMGEMNLKECLVFLDDISEFSETFEDHVSRFEVVFS